jgi:hypothetical protein
MANSYEIAQMFAQQNAMFMGQSQFAQSIGVPAFNQVGMGGQGLGAMGFGTPRGPGGGFSWGQSGMMGYGPGNAISSGLISGAGAAFTGGTMALGAASMFGMLGKAGAIMDPLAWGGTAFRAMGGGLAGGAAAAGAMALPIAAGLAIQHGVQSFVTGAQQQAQMNTMLGSQYQFFNPLSRTGSGFTRDDAKSIGDMVRHLSHVPELMTSYEELTRLAGKLKSSGVMQGVRSAAEFQSRFREAITTIRETAKILGTTMEEAEQFFTQSRSAGFYGRGAQLKNIMAAQFTSGVTGATVGQVVALQQAGADMAMQIGARRGLGATAVTNIAQNIGLAQREGRLREGAVEDVTGLQGPEAQLALAQRMFQGMVRFGQTAPGRLLMAGMMKYEGGRAVGVDEELARRFSQGLISVDELKARASRLTNDQKVSFTARQADLIASLAGQIGPGAAYGMMRSVLGEGRSADATNLIMQRLTGMSAGEIDIAQGMQGVSGDSEQAMFARFRQRQAEFRERTDPSAIMKRIKTRLHAATFGKLEQLGADVQNSIAKSIDQFFDDVVGREVSTLTEDRAKAIAQAFSGSQSAESREMLKSLTKLDSKGLATVGRSKGFLRTDRASVDRLTSVLATGGLALPYYAFKDALEDIGSLGGPESGMARFIAGLGGKQTEGQQREAINRMFGTSDLSKQADIAKRLASGNIAGTGAQGAILEIMRDEEFVGKTESEKMQAITGGLRSRVQDIARKMRLTQNLDTLGKMEQSTLDYYVNQAGLSKEEKALFSSFISASKNRVGKMDVFAQMAAASGLGGDFTSLVGATGSLAGDRAKLQENLKTLAGDEKQGLKSLIGGAAFGLLQSKGKRGTELLTAAIQDKDLQVALMGASTDPDKKLKAKILLAGKGIQVSDKEIDELAGAVSGFKTEKDEDVKIAVSGMQQYSDTADALASLEGREKMADTGINLLASSQSAGGKAGEAQKRLAQALIAIGQKGRSEETQRELQDAMKAYSEVLGGLKGEELDKALGAGGFAARQALDASKKRKDLAGRSFKNVKEAAAALGVTEEDLSLAGFQSGKLTKEQIEKFVPMGATYRTLVGAMSGEPAPGGGAKSETQQMVEAINTLNKNQSGIATLLATLSNDPDIKKKLATVLAGMNETGNAGPAGNTQLPGEQGQPKKG